MPTYDFKCEECGHVFTVLCKISERESQECPECKSKKYQSHHTSAPTMGDAVRMGVRKAGGDFKEVISKIHSKTPGSNLNKLL